MGHGSRNQTEAAFSARCARERRGCESADHRGCESSGGHLPAGRLFARRRLPRGLSHGDFAGAVRIAPRRRVAQKPRGLAARHADWRGVLNTRKSRGTTRHCPRSPPITSHVIEPSHQPTIFLIIHRARGSPPPGQCKIRRETCKSYLRKKKRQSGCSRCGRKSTTRPSARVLTVL